MTATNPSVLWTADASSPDTPSLIEGLRSLGWSVRLAASDAHREPFEVVVVEWQARGDVEDLQLRCMSHHQPVLVVVPSCDVLVAALTQARARDEVASATEGAAAIGGRLRRLAARRLHDAIGTDSLTGLPNRRMVQPWLEQALECPAPEGQVLGLVLLDIDHFKTVNDSYGHGTGDLILTRVAEQLVARARSGDACARMGGEEFLLLIRRDDTSQLRQDVESLLLVPVQLPDGKTFSCRLSAGMALGGPGLTPKDWLSRADIAMYEAKARGRHRAVFFEEVSSRSAPEDAEQAVQIRHFENVTQVVTQRVASLVSLMGQQMMRSLQREARQDALTGVPNRGQFDRRIEREVELASRDGRPLALLFFDIDNFGRFNREHGATVGDQVLRHFAATVAGGIRAVDWMARYGGEEFCVVMPAEIDEAAAAAERLRLQVEAAALPGSGGQPHKITTSIGVAAYAGGGEDVQAWVLRASKALQQAKGAGRNRVALAGRPEPEGAPA